jgi:hypothetical protein
LNAPSDRFSRMAVTMSEKLKTFRCTRSTRISLSKWGLVMTLKAWFQSKGIADPEAGEYADAFKDAKIPDDETKLPKLRLTREDLSLLGVQGGHLQTILDLIGELERGSESLADDRKDFIRRFVAVAVSVGFANRLIHMSWIDDITSCLSENRLNNWFALPRDFSSWSADGNGITAITRTAR